MKVIYKYDVFVENVNRKGGEVTDVSDKAGQEHITEGIAVAYVEQKKEPKKKGGIDG